MGKFLQTARELNEVLGNNSMRLVERAGKVSIQDTSTGIKVELASLFKHIAEEEK